MTCFRVTKAEAAAVLLSDAELEIDLLHLTLPVPLLPTSSFNTLCVHLPCLKCEARHLKHCRALVHNWWSIYAATVALPYIFACSCRMVNLRPFCLGKDTMGLSPRPITNTLVIRVAKVCPAASLTMMMSKDPLCFSLAMMVPTRLQARQTGVGMVQLFSRRRVGVGNEIHHAQAVLRVHSLADSLYCRGCMVTGQYECPACCRPAQLGPAGRDSKLTHCWRPL